MGDNLVFQFGAELFPRECFRAIWGTSCSLAFAAGGGVVEVGEPTWALLPPPFFFTSDESALFKIRAYQSVTQLSVHKDPRVGRC